MMATSELLDRADDCRVNFSSYQINRFCLGIFSKWNRKVFFFCFFGSCLKIFNIGKSWMMEVTSRFSILFEPIFIPLFLQLNLNLIQSHWDLTQFQLNFNRICVQFNEIWAQLNLNRIQVMCNVIQYFHSNGT